MDRFKTNTNNLILLLLSVVAIAVFLLNSSTVLLLVALFLLSLLIVLNLSSIRLGHKVLLVVNILSTICTLLLYEGTGVVLIFLALFMACVAFNSISFSQKTRRNVYFICCVGLLLLLATASSVYRVNGWLVLLNRYGNLINNNTLGIFSVAFCFCFLMWNDLRNGQKGKRLLAFVAFAVSFLFAYLTGCRSAMLVLLIYFVAHLFIKSKLSDKVFRRIIILIMAASLLFTVIYVALYSIWPDAMIMGKQLFSGREAIWIEAFKQIGSNFLFGSGTAFTSGGFESMHNMLLGIWKNVGLIPLISIASVFAICNRVPISRKQQIMIISMLLFIFFETFMMDINFLLLFAFLMTGTNENNVIEENGVTKDDT